MKYYSTNHGAPLATLKEAVVKGLAPDRGLYMPERIERLPQSFFNGLHNLSFQEIAYRVADSFFGEDVEADALRQIVNETLAFDCPLVKVSDSIYALELFHGPTLAFKDVGARFMARLLQWFNDGELPSHSLSESPPRAGGQVNVLVATSGDTGSAVANGFLGVEGIHVYVLYPKGKVSKIQECQFTTLGQNITAIEVDGVFDDCQRLVKTAFMDEELNDKMKLTSANSINVARFLPQAFYYFNAVARLFDEIDGGRAESNDISPVICVPSGNFGNLCAALFGHAMGLPVKRFIAANNANDIFYNYLQTGRYEPKPSRQTIANAMDVGAPSNFARIVELYGGGSPAPGGQPKGLWSGCHERISNLISGATYTDDEIRQTMRRCYEQMGYILDPHGACGYQALKDLLQPGETGIFCETAHPAKFKATVDETLGIDLPIPEKLAAFMQGQKQSVPLSNSYDEFKAFLMERSSQRGTRFAKIMNNEK